MPHSAFGTSSILSQCALNFFTTFKRHLKTLYFPLTLLNIPIHLRWRSPRLDSGFYRDLARRYMMWKNSVHKTLTYKRKERFPHNHMRELHLVTHISVMTFYKQGPNSRHAYTSQLFAFNSILDLTCISIHSTENTSNRIVSLWLLRAHG